MLLEKKTKYCTKKVKILMNNKFIIFKIVISFNNLLVSKSIFLNYVQLKYTRPNNLTNFSKYKLKKYNYILIPPHQK